MLVHKIFLFVGIVLGVVAQLMLKKGMVGLDLSELFRKGFVYGVRKMFFNVYVILGFFFYGISMLLWLVVLSELELSYAYPIISLGYFFVALSSRFVFHEKVSWQRWMSIFVIIIGVAIVGMS